MKESYAKWRKKVCLLLLGMVSCMALSSCGDSEDNADKDSNEKGSEAVNPNDETIGLKAYYPLDKVEGSVKLEDKSGNGNDALIFGKSNIHTEYEEGSTFLSDGAYFEIPADVFRGEDTLSISVWLKNYSGAINTSAIYFGTGETMPVNYWLLNPSNTAGTLKSVITNADDAAAPYNTEVGISPSVSGNGQEGPITGMGWNHYVTIITPTELTVYLNGEKVGTVEHTKKVSDFGDNLIAYIGKSAYTADATYTGFIKEVKIYDKELSEETSYEKSSIN